MDQGIERTGGKDGIGQFLQQLGHQDGMTCVQAVVDETHLDPEAGAVDDGDIGDLAARAAGGGQDDEFLFLLQFLAVKNGTGITAGRSHRQDFGHVDDGTAADGDDAAEIIAGGRCQQRVHHGVAGLSLAVIFQKKRLGTAVETVKKGFEDIRVAEDEVFLADVEACQEVLAGGEHVDGRFADELFHYRFRPGVSRAMG